MKFFETSFEDYLNSSIGGNDLHPELEKLWKHFPTDIHKSPHIICYGPSGTGRYTQILKYIRLFSDTNLKYEKRIETVANKIPFLIKNSDVHYEIDMALLGCNSKVVWCEVYNHLVDVISMTSKKFGIILCKNFQSIPGELLDVFYAYMQHNHLLGNRSRCCVRFILMTTNVSFISESIRTCSYILSVSVPTDERYKACKLSAANRKGTQRMLNLKYVKSDTSQLNCSWTHICNKIIELMFPPGNPENTPISMFQIREFLYMLLIYNFDIYQCMWYIFEKCIKDKHIVLDINDNEEISTSIAQMFKLYRGNYRPIYHLERFILYIIAKKVKPNIGSNSNSANNNKNDG